MSPIKLRVGGVLSLSLILLAVFSSNQGTRCYWHYQGFAERRRAARCISESGSGQGCSHT
jgi:hypothetical protein